MKQQKLKSKCGLTVGPSKSARLHVRQGGFAFATRGLLIGPHRPLGCFEVHFQDRAGFAKRRLPQNLTTEAFFGA